MSINKWRKLGRATEGLFAAMKVISPPRKLYASFATADLSITCLLYSRRALLLYCL